jgi:hypothetical protein
MTCMTCMTFSRSIIRTEVDLLLVGRKPMQLMQPMQVGLLMRSGE